MYSNVNAFKSQRWPNGAPNGPKGPGWHPQGYVAAKPCDWPRLACASILKIQNSVHFGAKWPHAKTNLNYLGHTHGPEGGCSPSWQHAPRCGPSVFWFGPLLGHTAASKMEKSANNVCKWAHGKINVNHSHTPMQYATNPGFSGLKPTWVIGCT